MTIDDNPDPRAGDADEERVELAEDEWQGPSVRDDEFEDVEFEDADTDRDS